MAWAILIVVSINSQCLVTFAQSDEASTESPAASRNVDGDIKAPQPAVVAEVGRFPDIDDSDDLPIGGYSEPSGFAWGKFAFVLLGGFVWLRSLRLCVDDGNNHELEVVSWNKSLFGFGFAGLITAIFLPAYLLGGCILIGACGVPFWRYVRWRNSQVSDKTPKLGWQHLFVSPDIPFRPAISSRIEIPSSAATGTPVGTISFIGKSFSNRTTSGDGQRPTAFQQAMALIGEAVAMRATDIHIGTKDDRVMVRLRIDGEIVNRDSLSIEDGLSVINVFKVLSDLNIADKRRSQDGSFRADIDDRRLCFRISSQGTNTGEKLSIRILDPAANFSTFSALGISEELEQRLIASLNRQSGLILVVGATGAGKSTTAYAALRYLDSGERNIVTIEDPIEYSVPSIDQIEVKSRAGQTFEAGLRSLLRQDADALLIGEIRDEETAKIACQAAMSGQLVLSTLHSTNSASAVSRMMDLGVDPSNVATALRAVVAQQLIRKLCTNCRLEIPPEEVRLLQQEFSEFDGQLYKSLDPLANPCLNCNSRGFLGRIGIFELLEVSTPIRELIRERRGPGAIMSAARESGMTTLWDSGVSLVRSGIISPQEFLRVVDE